MFWPPLSIDKIIDGGAIHSCKSHIMTNSTKK
jgi:hypothetical protein